MTPRIPGWWVMWPALALAPQDDQRPSPHCIHAAWERGGEGGLGVGPEGIYWVRCWDHAWFSWWGAWIITERRQPSPAVLGLRKPSHPVGPLLPRVNPADNSSGIHGLLSSWGFLVVLVHCYTHISLDYSAEVMCACSLRRWTHWEFLLFCDLEFCKHPKYPTESGVKCQKKHENKEKWNVILFFLGSVF